MRLFKYAISAVVCALACGSSLNAAVDVTFDSGSGVLEIDVTDTSDHDITVTVFSGGWVDVIIDSVSVKIYEGTQDVSPLASEVEDIQIFCNDGEETVDLSDVTDSNGFDLPNGTFVALEDGDDYFDGSEFDDFVCGDDGDDLLYGNDGDDDIDGGAGSDGIGLGSGDDTFYSLDGEYDIISTGPGTDTNDGSDATDLVF